MSPMLVRRVEHLFVKRIPGRPAGPFTGRVMPDNAYWDLDMHRLPLPDEEELTTGDPWLFGFTEAQASTITQRDRRMLRSYDFVLATYLALPAKLTDSQVVFDHSTAIKTGWEEL